MRKTNTRPKSNSLTLQLPMGTDPVRQFAEFEQLLVTNSGEDAFDIAIKLIAAKIEDELQARDQGADRRFMSGPSLTENHMQVEQLLRSAARRWQGIIEFNGGLVLTPDQLSRCTRSLIGWDILDTSFHHLDALLERLVARGSKGELGQYFTPRPVIRMCVAAVNPSQADTVIDPACGSGGFLVEALAHADSRVHGVGQSPGPRCLGIDYSSKSLKVASLLAVAAGRARISTDQSNSIDGRSFVGKDEPAAWSGFLRGSAGKAHWGPWSRLEASIVLTNPPFAGVIDDASVIQAYDSQRGPQRGRRSNVTRDHLFLERAVQLLKPGGRLAIVLPQGILANSSTSYLRHWLLRQVRVLGVVGLHPYTFFPHTGVKTAVLFAVKETPPTDYSVLFLTSSNPGKDSRGKATGDGDYCELGSLVRSFARQLGYGWASDAEPKHHDRYLVPIGQVAAADRLDSEYFDPELRLMHSRADALGVGSLDTQTSRQVARFKRREFSDIDYIDISSVDDRTGLTVPNKMPAEDAPSRAATIVQQGDVLVSTVRPERNVVAFVNHQPDVVTVASSGFCVLRPSPAISPEVLFAFCKSELFRSMVSRHATASMYPAVTDSDVLRTPAVLPEGNLATEIESRVRIALRKIEEAREDLAEAVRLMDTFHSKLLRNQ